jgi:hypothetical protein
MSQVKILETNILHASDVIYWLDGTSAETPAAMLGIAEPLTLQLTARPRDLQVVSGNGKTAFMRRPVTEIVDGVATLGDLQPPVVPPYVVAGTVSDPAGRIVPRRFSINAGQGAGHGVVVYPSPLGTRLGPAGGLSGVLRFAGSTAPVPWALLTLVVTSAVGGTFLCRCQASAGGDFLMPLYRLPPLPEGVASYAALLSVKAVADASDRVPIDPGDLQEMRLGDLDQEHIFASAITMTVVPGTIRTLRSANRDHVAVQPL